MKSRLALVLAAFLSGAHAEAEDGPATISGMTEELQQIQTRVAQGDKTAYAAQLDRLKAIGKAIATASPETWRKKREADALVVYVLSGGSLAEVTPLIKGDGLLESERALVRGAVAYITSHEVDAERLLGAIDPVGLDARLAGQIAFARSVLETKRDPKAAAGLLDWARVLAPGGLVEEAALRREILMLANTPDARRAARLTREYAIRFGASLYAPDFFRELARHLGEGAFAKDPAVCRLFSTATVGLPVGLRLDFSLTLARAAIVNGEFEAAAVAARDAIGEASAGSRDETRAQLYSNASRIFSRDHDSAVANFRTLMTSNLDQSDRNLLAAIRDAAAQFGRAPTPDAVEAQAGSASDEKSGAEARTIRDAEAALARTASVTAAAGSAP